MPWLLRTLSQSFYSLLIRPQNHLGSQLRPIVSLRLKPIYVLVVASLHVMFAPAPATPIKDVQAICTLDPSVGSATCHSWNSWKNSLFVIITFSSFFLKVPDSFQFLWSFVATQNISWRSFWRPQKISRSFSKCSEGAACIAFALGENSHPNRLGSSYSCLKGSEAKNYIILIFGGEDTLDILYIPSIYKVFPLHWKYMIDLFSTLPLHLTNRSYSF